MAKKLIEFSKGETGVKEFGKNLSPVFNLPANALPENPEELAKALAEIAKDEKKLWKTCSDYYLNKRKSHFIWTQDHSLRTQTEQILDAVEANPWILGDPSVLKN